jgi:hypothetical protein
LSAIALNEIDCTEFRQWLQGLLLGCGGSCREKQTQKDRGWHHVHNLGSNQATLDKVGRLRNHTKTSIGQNRQRKKPHIISQLKLTWAHAAEWEMIPAS